MDYFELLKIVLTAAKEFKNKDLNKQIIDLEELSLKKREEIIELKQEIMELRKKQNLEDRIERHEQPYLTLKGDNPKIRYCATCWGRDKIIIQIICNRNGSFKCPNCKIEDKYDLELYEKSEKEYLDIMSKYGSNPHSR